MIGPPKATYHSRGMMWMWSVDVVESACGGERERGFTASGDEGARATAAAIAARVRLAPT